MKNTEFLNTNTDDYIKLNLDKPDLEKIIILKKEEIPFKKDETIAKYKLKGKENINYIKSPIYGWIAKYEEDNKILILEKCKHEMFYVRTCTKCGYEKSEEDKKDVKTYGFMNNDFSFSKEKAESLEKLKVENYLTSKKLILLLDLDNTILHCASVLIEKEQVKSLMEKYKLYLSKIPIKNALNRYDGILIKFRPYLKTFLKNIKNKFEIFIYTQATKEYATGIIQYINKNFEEDILSTGRMIPRKIDENGFAQNKSIKNVFPTQEKMVLIIDDNIDVWKESGNNFICIYPYRFFSEKDKITNELFFFNGFDKKSTKELFLKVEYDNVLFCITNLLLNVHRKFFKYYEKYNFMKSLGGITNDTLKLILLRKKFYYHLNFDKGDLISKKSKIKTKNEIEENNNNEKSKITTKENGDNLETEKINDNKDNIIQNNKDNSKEVLTETNKNEEGKEKKSKKYSDEMKNKFKNILKYKIQKLGGEIIEEEKDMFQADIFLTDFYDENDPIIKSIEDYKEKKVNIVHCHYIEICLMYFFHVKIEDFILSKENKYLKVLDLNKVFEKNKDDIVKFYGNNEFIEEN